MAENPFENPALRSPALPPFDKLIPRPAPVVNYGGPTYRWYQVRADMTSLGMGQTKVYQMRNAVEFQIAQIYASRPGIGTIVDVDKWVTPSPSGFYIQVTRRPFD